MINAEIQKNDNETAINTIRRFSKRVQGTGLIQEMRSRRYFTRAQSRSVARKHALKVIKRRAEVKMLIKLGKLAEERPRKRGGKRR